ncbi:hypothetical protein ENH_00057400 [Eimeria necatrix]|uniref:Uncharacterized protein n=1 Tax=Eimeria necatrix TaxID=51315 RepID=U6MXQ3_9EIME|nr:hypothetical protein ENH_00057400 [Eimeria necatrix]CDJ68736.1 hypothetical protein ENH_00057400 [Eimeria necatrix]
MHAKPSETLLDGTVVEGHGPPIDHQTFFKQLKAKGELEDEVPAQHRQQQEQQQQQQQQQQEAQEGRWLQQRDWQDLPNELQQHATMWEQPEQQQQQQQHWDRQMHW